MPVNKYVVSTLTALSLAIGAGSFAYADARKSVTIDVDGQTVAVDTFARTVADVLAAEGITVGENDDVLPALDAKLTEGEAITVRYAADLVFVDGNELVTTTRPVLDAAEALDLLSESRDDVALVASRSGDRVELPVRLDDHAPVAVVADGQEQILDRSGGSIETALFGAGITLGAEDTVRVVPAATIPALADSDVNVAVVVTRIVTTEETTEFELPFEQVQQNDGNRYKGDNAVVQAGEVGKRVLVEQVVTTDGVETSRTTLSDEVVAEPVDEITAIGTKEKPAPAPAPAPAAAPAAQGSAPAGTVWAQLAQCESGGNPGIVSANGLYHGLYQFSVATWQAMGGSGLPSQASAEEQTMRAQMLQARSGWGQWPACARKLGLL